MLEHPLKHVFAICAGVDVVIPSILLRLVRYSALHGVANSFAALIGLSLQQA